MMHEVEEIYCDQYTLVRDLVAKTPFLARKKWDKPVADITFDGIVCAEWHPIGIFEDGKLVAYMDYKVKAGITTIGMFVTDDAYKRRGYATALFQYIFEMYPDNVITTSVDVKNEHALRLLRSLGFETVRYQLADRIDGTDTAVLAKAPVWR